MFDAKRIKEEIVEWVKEYFKQNDCTAVIGISGGKDSAIVAAICVEALGTDRVYGVLMPSGEQKDIESSQLVVNHLGIKHCIINIKEPTDSLQDAINKGGLKLNKQAVINAPSRIRMSVLYAVSAIVNGRVANTCNLSENWVGYATKYGDSAGDFSPLAQLTVREVKAIGRELGLPLNIVEKVPEDGLSGLTDEDNLGFSYDVLDKYIREGICEDIAVKEKIDNLNKNNRHKLEAVAEYGNNH